MFMLAFIDIIVPTFHRCTLTEIGLLDGMMLGENDKVGLADGRVVGEGLVGVGTGA
jgi:hypothetical protein